MSRIQNPFRVLCFAGRGHMLLEEWNPLGVVGVITVMLIVFAGRGHMLLEQWNPLGVVGVITVLR